MFHKSHKIEVPKNNFQTRCQPFQSGNSILGKKKKEKGKILEIVFFLSKIMYAIMLSPRRNKTPIFPI